MRSFFPPLMAMLLVFCASEVLAQVSVIGSSNARECFNEALRDGADSRLCDKALSNDLLVGRNLAATYVNRAVVRTNAGDMEGALKDLERAESMRPEFGEIYASRGNVYYHLSSFEEALAEYDRSIEAGMQKLHAAHYDRGLALEQLGRIEEAKEAFRRSIEIAPTFELAKTRLAFY